MGSLPRPAIAHGASYRANNSRVLLPVLLLSLPVLALLVHCAYHRYDHGHSADLSHGLEPAAPFAFADGLASATFLYVASYGGTVTTFKLTKSGVAKSLDLEPVASTDGCAGSPSWLTLDHANSILYCTDEGLTTGSEGSLSSFSVIEDGSLVRLDRVRTVFGPVSAAVYGKDRNGLALAHYGGSALSTWNVEDPSAITSVQTRLFKMAQPGPDPSRQEAPHPHAAVVDPTGQFILVPDLGADLIRVYAIRDGDLDLTERDPLFVAPGSGPRHLAFADRGEKTFMYLVTELGNTVVGYEVTYDDESIAFEEVWTSGIHGKGNHVPTGGAASEIIISPDSNFLILSSRNESTLEIPNFDPDNSTAVASDPLINFAIDPQTGHLDLVQETPCGGLFPRQFSINKAGTLVAVGLQSDGRVVIIERDTETGELGNFVAHASIEGEVTAVIFNE
ncbi:Lactonase, 7-bladed beta-propeller-domain-containing protein [Ilyonectria sp. MPI-CAGE-AT-0026]|nr:Lactonase, 7-bladed beta-propeller-domain-containing protein [Ilyonectria sp. MPI-CAGE-AT-0026]